MPIRSMLAKSDANAIAISRSLRFKDMSFAKDDLRTTLSTAIPTSAEGIATMS